MPQEKRARPEAGGTPPKQQQQSKPAPRAAVAAMPVVGDLLEAIYAEGCWVPARAIGVRSRQVHVEFELPEPEPPRALLEAAHYFCEEDDTPKEVSRRFGVPVAAVLALNASRLEGLVSTSRLRRRTILALPLVHAVAENETPRAAAAALGLECGSLVAANGALDAELGPLGPATRLPADTQLLLPAGAPPPQYGARQMPLLASSVELAGWCAGEGWRVAEVRRLLGGARFVAVAAEEAKEEELRLRDEGKTWRWPDGARPRGGGERARSGGEGRAAAVGEVVDVEVEEGGATRWRAAEVRELLGEGRFRVCVDGDEDFVEEYGPDEEGSEWRWPPHGRSRATEWVAAGFTRPRPPRAPTNFLAAAAGGGTVQVLQDGGWWQAAIADDKLLLGPPPATGSGPGGEGGGAALAEGEAAEEGCRQGSREGSREVTLFLLARNADTALRVHERRVRPDWEMQREGSWRVVPPPPLRALRPLAEAGRGTGRGTAPTPSGGAELLAASAAPPLGPPLKVHPWASVGRTAEASLAQPAARGAWWEVELLELQPHAALVEFLAFAERDGAAQRLQEWVAWHRLRPAPPRAPSDFLHATRAGEGVQLWWEDAWWEATLLEELALQGDREGQGERAEPPARARVRLRGAAALVGAPQSVVCGQLRPAWEWRLVEGAQGYGEWVAPCIAPVGVVAAGEPDGGIPPP